MSVNFYKLMRRLQWGTHLGLAGGKRVKKKLTDILLMYGFHGISYSFILREAAEFLQKVWFLLVPSAHPR